MYRYRYIEHSPIIMVILTPILEHDSLPPRKLWIGKLEDVRLKLSKTTEMSEA